MNNERKIYFLKLISEMKLRQVKCIRIKYQAAQINFLHSPVIFDFK
jgi:hypothetical protein